MSGNGWFVSENLCFQTYGIIRDCTSEDGDSTKQNRNWITGMCWILLVKWHLRCFKQVLVKHEVDVLFFSMGLANGLGFESAKNIERLTMAKYRQTVCHSSVFWTASAWFVKAAGNVSLKWNTISYPTRAWYIPQICCCTLNIFSCAKPSKGKSNQETRVSENWLSNGQFVNRI